MDAKSPLAMSDAEVEAFFADDDAPLSSSPSDFLACNVYPNCEWGSDCDGNHSYSPWRNEDDDDGFVGHGEEGLDEQSRPLSPWIAEEGVNLVPEDVDGCVVPDSESDA